MANYRCPVCGAGHKSPQEHCRLCGASLTEVSHIPQGAQALKAAPSKQGVGIIIVVGIVGVLVVILLAVVFEFGERTEVVETIKDEVPGLNDGGSDGWQTVDDADGGFTVEMPGTPERGFVALPGTAAERADQLISTIGEETELTVAYAPVTVPPDLDRGQTVDLLKWSAHNWAASQGGKILDIPVTETVQSGHLAVEFTAERTTVNGEPATAKGVIFLAGDTVYILQSNSIYPDHSQLGRLRSTFELTA
jgi:hypothetical protein